jgi:hypothetical protein
MTKEYTFKELFCRSIPFEDTEIILGKIEIPIIQRDYAQGRTNNKVERIRNKFLDALFLAITKHGHITLDFVYGDVIKSVKEKREVFVLTPLDGQQRLTTLFLLHWYIAKKENIDANEYEFLGGFSYETRFSSRDFCQELIKFSPDFSKKTLSDDIKDQAWYPYEWKNDPTIQSMLVMINAIHEKFKEQPGNLWKSLVTGKSIGFYFLSLTEMGLPDELYIKMNSRGKPLTTFEHFKAEFEEIIKHNSEELSEEINHKFDIEWTDIFFPFRGEENIIDDEFMRYFHFISDILCYKLEIGFEKDEFKLANLLYGKDNASAKDDIEYFKNSFDCWYDFDIVVFFDTYFSQNTYGNGKVKLYQNDLNIFKECCDNYGELTGRNRRFPLNKILLLYSINIYLQNKIKISEDEFKRRIRIIRNLIWNSTYEIRDDRMKTLLSETETIILTGAIPSSERGDLGYNVWQKEEERKKIEWLDNNSQLKDELFQLEDHVLLKGCIAVVGLDHSANFEKFRLLFDICEKDLINRALLCIGDYSQSVSWRCQIGARSIESVWINLFHPTNQRQRFDETSRVLNVLLSEIDGSIVANENLEEFVNKYLNNHNTQKDWRYYFIKYQQMRQGNFGMYYWANRLEKPYEIIMMNTETSMGGRNWNVFLCTLYNSPVFSDKLTLEDYAYQGNKLKIKNTDIEIDCLNDKYIIYQNGEQKEYRIEQLGGIDKKDRIEIGKEIINDIILNIDRAK